jgi:hypothetical protein
MAIPFVPNTLNDLPAHIEYASQRPDVMVRLLTGEVRVQLDPDSLLLEPRFPAGKKLGELSWDVFAIQRR